MYCMCTEKRFSGLKKALKSHKESKHEGIRYPCDQCEYAATRLGHLKSHKESKHEGCEGVRYPCDQCEHTFMAVSDMKKHKRSKHPCDQYSIIESHEKAELGVETNVDNVDQNESTTLRRKVNVKIQKLDYSEYLRSQNTVKPIQPVFVETSHMNVVDTEIKEEEITEEDPLSDTIQTSTSDALAMIETVTKAENDAEQMRV